MLTSTTAEVNGKNMISITLASGATTVKKEQRTFIATKNDIKHIALINVFFLLKPVIKYII